MNRYLMVIPAALLATALSAQAQNDHKRALEFDTLPPQVQEQLRDHEQHWDQYSQQQKRELLRQSARNVGIPWDRLPPEARDQLQGYESKWDSYSREQQRQIMREQGIEPRGERPPRPPQGRPPVPPELANKPLPWNELTPEQQILFAPVQNDWNSLPPMQQRQMQAQAASGDQAELERIKRRMERFQSLSPEEKAHIQQRMERYQSLSPEEQEKLRNARERFQDLPPERRQELRQRWRDLSPEERKAMREQLKKRRTGKDDKE